MRLRTRSAALLVAVLTIALAAPSVALAKGGGGGSRGGFSSSRSISGPSPSKSGTVKGGPTGTGKVAKNGGFTASPVTVVSRPAATYAKVTSTGGYRVSPNGVRKPAFTRSEYSLYRNSYNPYSPFNFLSPFCPWGPFYIFRGTTHPEVTQYEEGLRSLVQTPAAFSDEPVPSALPYGAPQGSDAPVGAAN